MEVGRTIPSGQNVLRSVLEEHSRDPGRVPTLNLPSRVWIVRGQQRRRESVTLTPAQVRVDRVYWRPITLFIVLFVKHDR